MSKRRRFSFKNKILSEWQCINHGTVLAGAVLSLFFGIVFAVISGGFEIYALLCLPDAAPPFFIFPIVWSIIFILLGAVAGAVISCRDKCFGNFKRRGLLYFTVMYALLLAWAPVFFGCQLFFCGFVLLCAVLVLAFFNLLCFCRIYFLAGAAFFLYWLWLVFMLYLNLAILFLN